MKAVLNGTVGPNPTTPSWWTQRRGELLLPGRGGRNRRGRGVELPGTDGRGRADHRPTRVLDGRQGVQRLSQGIERAR